MPRGESYHEQHEEEFYKSLKFKKVTPEGQGWVERRQGELDKADKAEKEDSIFSSRRTIFGHDVLSSWEFINKKGAKWNNWERLDPIPSMTKIVIHGQKKIFESSLKTLYNDFAIMAKSNFDLLNYFFSSYLLHSGVDTTEIEQAIFSKKQQKKFGESLDAFSEKDANRSDDRRPYLAVYMTLSFLMRGKRFHLPEQILLPMLEYHEKQVLAKEEKIVKEIDTYRERIAPLLLEASKQGKLPLSPELIKERLSHVTFKVIDEMTARLEEIWGDYEASKHIIRISTGIPPELQWSTFVHEIFHALSGQIEILKSYSDDTTEKLYLTETTKVGVKFSNSGMRDETFSTREYLHWLNEALTEQAKLELIDQATSYANERKLLHLLIESGVPQEMLFAAYFENYDAEKKTGEHRLPKTKELFTTTNEKLGKGFLMNLNAFIRRNTAQKTVAKWKELQSDFPKYINDWAREKRSK